MFWKAFRDLNMIIEESMAVLLKIQTPIKKIQPCNVRYHKDF